MSSIDCEYIWKFVRQNDCQGMCNVTDDVLCTICGKIMVNAYIGSCGCRYCLECITHYLNGTSQFCPGNKEDCLEEYLDISRNVHADYASHRKILKLIVKCPRDWCEFRDELRKIEAHERLCEKQTVACPYCRIGCQETQSVKDKINEHLLVEIESHARLLIEYLGVLHNEIGLVKSDVQNLREQVTHVEDLVKENKSIREENQSIKNEIGSTKNENITIKVENQSIKNETESTKEELEIFRRECLTSFTSMAQESSEMRIQRQTMTNEMEDLRLAIQSIKAENAHLREEIRSVKNESALIKDERRSVKDELDKSQKECGVQMECGVQKECIESLASVKQELSEMCTQKQTITNEMEDLRLAIQSIKEENAHVREEIRSVKDESALIKDERRSVKDELDKSQKECVESLASVKQELSEMCTRGLAQAKEVECSNKEIDLLKAENKSIKEENESIKNVNKSIKDELDSFRTEYLELYVLIEHQLSDMKTERQAQKMEIESLKEQIDVVKTDNQFIIEENISIKEKNESIAVETESIKEENRLIIEENRPRKEENESTQEDIGSMHEEVNDYNVLEGQIREQSRTQEISQSGATDSRVDAQLGNEQSDAGRRFQVELDKQEVSENDAVRVWQMDINNNRSSKGEFVWSIDNWTEWTGWSTETGECEQIFSHPFYSHERGYKMCLSAITQKRYLYIRWHLMSGKFDNKLRWPFEGSVVLSIIDQVTLQDYSSYRETSDGPRDYRWNRPTKERNDGFGKLFWIRLSDISQNREVCKSDRIFIRCVVTLANKKRS